MRKILIIGNCHTMSLARSFALCARDIEVNFIDLNFLNRDHENALNRELYDGLTNYEVVFSFLTSERMAPVSTKQIASILGDRLVTFTNLRFHGLHPDLTLIGPMDGRRHGFLGIHHSKLILFAFLRGMSPRDCGRLFDYKIYEKIGYFEMFSTSANELLQRDRGCDIKFAHRFIEIIREEYCLYTFNHPNGRVFQALTAALCSWQGIDFVEFARDLSINELSNNYVWPIYDEIAEFHRLPYRTPQYFVNVQSFSSRAISRDEMIKKCYDVYSKYPLDEFHRLLQAEPFYLKFQETIV